MMTKIRAALTPPTYQDAEKTRKSNLLNSLLAILILLMIIVAPIIIFTAPQNRTLFFTIFLVGLGLLFTKFIGLVIIALPVVSRYRISHSRW